MAQTIFTYTDSAAGAQSENFNTFSETLSELIKHIESFGYHGDSDGEIFQNGKLILCYVSRESGLTWQSA